eukprot:1159033-Pelagomonas_calceolata.AAC.7
MATGGTALARAAKQQQHHHQLQQQQQQQQHTAAAHNRNSSSSGAEGPGALRSALRTSTSGGRSHMSVTTLGPPYGGGSGGSGAPLPFDDGWASPFSWNSHAANMGSLTRYCSKAHSLKCLAPDSRVLQIWGPSQLTAQGCICAYAEKDTFAPPRSSHTCALGALHGKSLCACALQETLQEEAGVQVRGVVWVCSAVVLQCRWLMGHGWPWDEFADWGMQEALESWLLFVGATLWFGGAGGSWVLADSGMNAAGRMRSKTDAELVCDHRSSLC